jgi:hypothetical protein
MLAEIWRKAGHRVIVVCGLDDLPRADLAFLHVDLSVVPEAYLEAGRRYPRAVNGRARDIRKRVVSRNLVGRDSGWTGPVVVKSDLNYGGIPEWHIEHAGRPDAELPANLTTYSFCRNIASVPAPVWDDPRLVVERFLPERDARGFCVRTWTFLGDRGVCRRSRGAEPFVKSLNSADRDDVPVPDFIRSERERLGIDYGTLDFAMHKGEPVLFDANKTFGVRPTPGNRLYRLLAEGLDGLLA